MNASSNDPSISADAVTTQTLTLRQSPIAPIKTRRLGPWVASESQQGIIKTDRGASAGNPQSSLVTHRPPGKLRRQLLKGFGVVLGFFPPVWPFYLGGWLFWRSRPPQKSMRQVRKAIQALEKGQTGIALKLLQDAHYLNPNNNDALYWLGMVLKTQNRHEEAADALSLVSERIPELPEVEAALVDIYVAMQESEAAVYHAQRLLDMAPYQPKTPLKLADAFEAAGRIDLAIEALERAPVHKRVLTQTLVEIHYRLGILHERQANSEKALHHFKRVLAKDISFKDVRFKVEALEDKLK